MSDWVAQKSDSKQRFNSLLGLEDKNWISGMPSHLGLRGSISKRKGKYRKKIYKD